MESRKIKIHSTKNSDITISVYPGHFATNHSHINYYIDMTSIKHRYQMAHAVGSTLAMKYQHVPVEAIVCMDGCEMVGGFLAHNLVTEDIIAANIHSDIRVITPNNTNGQLTFQENVQAMVNGKNILLLLGTATTGKSINRALECIKYYGGSIVGISAIFSAITECQGMRIDNIFNAGDVEGYQTYANDECPFCQRNQKLDAIVSSSGYTHL